MNVVDSSAWLEYFADGPNAAYFRKPIEDEEALIVPSITLFEVFKRVYIQRGEEAALRAIATMESGQVIDLGAPLALQAAYISANNQLPMADSIILATARAFDALLWTQDADFERFDGVKYRVRGG